MPHGITRTDHQQHSENGKADRRAFLGQREIGRQRDWAFDRHRAGQLVGGQDFFGIESDMQRIGAQESRDVGGAGKKIEAALLDCFEVLQANAQRHLNGLDAEAARFALITQQTTDCTARRRLAFHRPPINLIWHNL